MMTSVILIVLIIGSILIAGFATRMCRLTGNASPAFGVAVIYLWTIYPAWHVLLEKNFESLSYNFTYLYDYLIPLELDIFYLITLISFFIFVLTIQLFYILTISNYSTSFRFFKNHGRVRFFQSRNIFLILSILAGVLLFFSKVFFLSFNSTRSLYELTRFDNIQFDGLIQVVNRVGLASLCLGLFIALSQKKSEAKWRGIIIFIYVGLIAVFATVLTFLGNRNELVFAIIFFITLNSLAGFGGKFLQLLVLGVPGLLIVDFVYLARGSGLTVADYLGFEILVSGLVRILTTNDFFPAHMSLYGVIQSSPNFLFGQSFLSLFKPIIPYVHTISSYNHYINVIDPNPGQGYTISHATSWYLNFGFLGIVLGGVSLGCLWGYFAARAQRAKCQMARGYTGKYIGLVSFIALLPNTMRAGIEGYFGMVVIIAAISMALITFQRLRFSPGRL